MIGIVFLIAAATCSQMKDFCESPVSAESIADSVGINVHLHNGDTVYGDFTLIKRLLSALGARHTRDGLIDTTWLEYYQRHIALARLGVKCLFITSPTQSDALLISWPRRVPGAFEAYEAPNEYDRSGDPEWVATLRSFVPRLYRTIKSDPATSNFSVVGPSLTQPGSYSRLGGLQQYFDFGNMHNYLGGRNPGTSGWGDGGYGSIDYSEKLNQIAWPDRPLITTETGYMTDPRLAQGIPELIEGKYAPRLILEQALHGVQRTYIYELIDQGNASSPNERAFGLARVDGSHKPAFTALQNLIAMLSDPGPQHSHTKLQFSLEGASNNVHHLLMAKNDGSYYLAFWVEKLNYDVNKHTELRVDKEELTFVSNLIFKESELVTFDANGLPTSTRLKPFNHTSLTATDCISILVLR